MSHLKPTASTFETHTFQPSYYYRQYHSYLEVISAYQTTENDIQTCVLDSGAKLI